MKRYKILPLSLTVFLAIAPASFCETILIGRSDATNAVVPFAPTETRKLTARDYVQDGLVHLWDGIETGGWGVTQFGQSNITWVDLVSGTGFKGTAVATESGVAASSSDTPYPSSSGGIPVGIQGVSQWTVQYCLSFSYATGSCTIRMQGGSNTYGNYPSVYYPFQTTKVRFQFGTGTGITVDTPFAEGALAVLTATRDSSRHYGLVYYNGISYYTGAMAEITTFPNRYVLINDTSAYDSATNTRGMRIKCIRIYNRALTPYEAMLNTHVDEQRFKR